MNDPEKYQRDNFNRLQHSISARWHGKDKVLHLLYYKTHRVQKGGALFGKPAAEVKTLAGWKSPAVPKVWKVDDFQSMPLSASNWASSSINLAGSISGAKVC